MISVVTNAVVALMVVSNTYQKVEGFEVHFRQDDPVYVYGNGRYVHKTLYPETLYRIVNTTNFVYQRDYDACKEAVKYIQDNCVTTNKYPVIGRPIWDSDLDIPIHVPVLFQYVVTRRKGGAE